ncbi:adenosylcobinamide-phosphate synthase CbiB [Poseidonocella sedimentorum]|uniref:Cobalamin biosynthesis protein CobD n=1 Tax=Poseidonocella sedimentorum TaxID=871652 RepID=A0A1I6EKN6_9RHOB|nr:adenosylcobinamide-phosphate synthase CbiB [Poseidonocella sedimentorum]SFR18111.1 adenosylcobinamide-phosphate synthase [Poseidonocella sedimentorum]
MSFAAAMLLALAIELAIGWPDALYRRIGHPVTWIGALISALEGRLNRGAPSVRNARGILALVVVVLATGLPALVIGLALPSGPLGVVLTGLLAWPFLALRSLHSHLRAVDRPLSRGDIPGARQAVSMIVGRETAALGEEGIARAALESLAENTSDGIVAPLFWGALLGLPGIALYKAINTADSMIGHRSARYAQFGRAAARLDDLVNLLPARLSGIAFALVSARPLGALRTMRRDAPQHRSPNAGWPEAAMAAGLGVRLSGPREYGGQRSDEPWLNPGAPDPLAPDLARGLALYRRAMVLVALGLLGLAAI